MIRHQHSTSILTVVEDESTSVHRTIFGGETIRGDFCRQANSACSRGVSSSATHVVCLGMLVVTEHDGTRNALRSEGVVSERRTQGRARFQTPSPPIPGPRLMNPVFSWSVKDACRRASPAPAHPPNRSRFGRQVLAHGATGHFE